jgi:transketolase
MKERFGWDPEKSFHVPEEVLAHMQKVIDKGKEAESAWDKMLRDYSEAYPELAQQFRDAGEGKLGLGLEGGYSAEV